MGGHRAAADSDLRRNVKCWKVGQPAGTPFLKQTSQTSPVDGVCPMVHLTLGLCLLQAREAV